MYGTSMSIYCEIYKYDLDYINISFLDESKQMTFQETFQDWVTCHNLLLLML